MICFRAVRGQRTLNRFGYMTEQKKKDLCYCCIWCLVLLVGILLRVLYLTKYPAGVNADEAYAGYEAYALLHNGTDSHGYSYPVYFISWGNGMNVLYSYLSIPFQAILGISIFSIRLPQAVIGCVTLIAFYWLLREIRDKKTALFGMFLLAITPWHIMMCRWGLESNLVPALVLFGICFLIAAWKGKKQYYIGAFLMFGLVLYAYAIMWIFVPVLLLLGFIYGLYYRKITINPYLLTGIAILIVLAIPLVVFLLVNRGYLPELKIGLLSIPKMDTMRSSEISFDNMAGKLKDFFLLVATQQDRDIFNTANTGIYYYCSIPFLITGVITAIVRFVKNWKNRTYQPADIMLLWFAASCAVASVISYVNVNKINCVHLVILYFIIDGVRVWCEKLSGKLIYLVILVYLVSFVIFGRWYYDAEKHYFYYGYEEALDYAESVTDGEIGTVMLRYPLVLVHAKMLPTEYLTQLEDTKNFGTAQQFGRYRIEPTVEDMNPDTVYVVPEQSAKDYLKEGYQTTFDNGYYVVIESNHKSKGEKE